MDISFQLYSARNFQPWGNILKMLSANGYSQVEGFADVYENPDDFCRLLEQNNLLMPSGHFSLEALTDDFQGVLRTAKTLGISCLICPYLDESERPDDKPGWKSFAGTLNRLADKISAEGFEFAWHNHEFELEACEDGSLPLDVILNEAPDLKWEADIGWIARSKANPTELLRRYGEKINAVHIKDLAREGENGDEDGWADVGSGILDWPSIVKALKKETGTRLFVIEHDNPKNIEKFIVNSARAAKNF